LVGRRLIIIAMMLQRLSRARHPTVNLPCMPPASTHTGDFIRQEEEGGWICPKSEEVLKKAGVLTIEEYIQKRRETIMKYAQTRDIYGKCKSSRKIASNLLGGRLIIIAMTL